MRAVLGANAEMVRLYWDIGQMNHKRQQREGWGAAVIPRLARELRNELPELKGFSERNITLMVAFYREYRDVPPIAQQAVAQLPGGEIGPLAVAQFPKAPVVSQPATQLRRAKKLPQPVAKSSIEHHSLLWLIPWGHHVLLLAKEADRADRLWSMQQTLANGWSRNMLALASDSRTHERQGKATTNFAQLLPMPQFYHLRLRSFVVIDLKTGPFKPEYAGKLNFYCNKNL